MDSEGPDQTADAQSDLDLCCPHIPKDMFSHGMAHIMLTIQKDMLAQTMSIHMPTQTM